MNRKPIPKLWLLAVIAAMLLVAVAAVPLARRAGSAPLTPAQAVQQAWQRARDAGAYRFSTDLSATAYPAATLANAGRSAREERLHLEGSVDLPARTLLLSLWQGGGSLLNPSDGVEVRIEGDRAYGRRPGGRWEEIDDFSGGFAPGGDLLVYLAGAKNVVELGTETRVLPVPEAELSQQDEGPALPPASFVSYTRYAFELDGPALAEEVRRQWQQALLEQGGLPSGVEIQAPAALRDCTGHGELWLDGGGLPARLTVEIAYPPDAAGAGGRATIQTDLSGFPPQQVEDPAGWLAGFLDLKTAPSPGPDLGRVSAQAALLAAVAGLSVLLVRYSRSRRLYIAVVLAIILSMVITPLAESQRTAAFGQQQAAQRAAGEERQAEARARQEYQEAMHSSSWDPQQDSLAASEQLAALSDPSGLHAGSGQPNAGAALAPSVGPYQVTHEVLAGEAPPEPESDADLDTLTAIEEERLGTDPDNPDTDGDQLRDDLEVKGFVLGGKTWYGDPLSVDTNNDGRSDLYECWSEFPETMPSNTACNLDIDGDKEPDLFDRDNDGDGVPDGVDLSPMSKMAPAGGAFTSGIAFQLSVEQPKPGKPTFVDLQLRPTSAAQLTYAYSVLDWPSGDTDGQVQRVLDTTLADGMTAEEVQKDPRSANGDLRLIPMVEITVPYKAGHTRNLPVKVGWTGTLTATTPLEDWVDVAMLAQYGITARYADEAGTVVLYAPLSLVSDEVGGASVAFTTRLPYKPVSSDWGTDHQIRFVWALQMLVDQCKAVPDGEDAESWCAEAQNREEQVQIVQTYYEPWIQAGLNLTVDDGVQMAIAFEDPAQETGAALEDDRHLWALANGLDQSWITARDLEPKDSHRDLDLPEIVHRFDNETNGDIPEGDARLWGIPKKALKLWGNTFAYQDLLASVPMTYTKEILNQHFLRSGQPVTPAPTLMFLREQHYWTANLDSRAEVASRSGARLTLNLVPEIVKRETMAIMSWSPYRYRDGGWEPYPLEEYVELLDSRLAKSFPPDPNDPDGEAIAEGQVIVARGYYLGMVQGTQALVQNGDIIHEDEEAESRDAELKLDSIEVSGDVVLTIVEAAGLQLMEFAYFLIGHPKFSSVKDLCQWLSEASKDISTTRGNFVGWNALNKAGVPRYLSVLNKIGIATLILTCVFSCVLFLVSILVDSPVILYIQDGLMVAAAVIRFTASTVKFISEMVKIFGAGLKDGLLTLIHKVTAPWSGALKATLVLAIVIESLVALGVFIYTWVSAHIMIGSLAWDQMLVDMIARIVVAALIWALSLIPVIGDILYLLVTLLDAIAKLICDILGVEEGESDVGDWLCGGVSSILTNIFTWLFYGQHFLVDMEDESRWQMGVPEIQLGDAEKGFAVGNTLAYQVTLTNSIHLSKIPADWKAACYAWQYNVLNLQRSTFDYSMSGQEEADLGDDLKLDQQESLWNRGPERDGKRTYHIAYPVDTEGAGAPLIEAGINITSSIYIHEGYALPVQECIAVPVPPLWWTLVPICWVRATKGTNSANIGDSFLWDVFPENLDKFYQVAAVDGGYSLAWAQGDEVRFPRQKDFDGDSLINKTDGGPDPNDSRWDADSDGLSDYFELEVGTKPDEVGGYDPDGDGLNDREELLLGTNPFKPDTDGDGLTDRVERDGWEFAYGLDASNKPKMSWVTSDPLQVDGDGDTLTDFQEYNYRYHPRVASDPNVLGFSSQLSESTPSGYVPSDGLVRSGDQLRYEASVENKTLLSSARGLHAARFATDRLSGSVAPRTFLLYPREKKTLSGDLGVKTGIPSGPADVTQTAGARITYALADSDYAQLVLHLEDAAAATTFADSSGNAPPHNGQCADSGCPTRQVAGYLGAAVEFDAAKYQMIKVPDADISAGDFGVSFWFKAQPAGGALFSSQDGSVNLVLQPEASGGHLCTKIDVLESTAVPCTSLGYADNLWHFLALSFEQAAGPNLFVDGEWVLGGWHAASTRVNPNPQRGVWLGYSPYQSGPLYESRWYTGLLDEVVVYDRPFTWQDVNALYGRPAFAMHLDEPAGATSFAEDGGLAGTCSGSACPVAGKPGAVRQSALFDGGDNIRFTAHPWLGAMPFTIAAWILPTVTGNSSTDSAPQGIVGQLSPSLQESYPTLVRVGTGIQAAFGAGTGVGLIQMPLVPNVLVGGAWNHVVLTYGANQDGKGQFDLYINGTRRGTSVQPGYPTVSGTISSFNVGNVWAGVSPVDPSYPSSPFRGQIDEVLIYPYVLSEAQVDELHRNQADALHLPFDEPPGTYQFQDALRRATGSCPADLVTCPTAGVAGRAGQAALFDGVDDSLDAGVLPAVSGTGPLSLAAWVRTGAAKEQVIVQQRSPAVYNGQYQLRLTAAGKVHWMTYGNGGAARFDLYSAKSVNDGKWHHVAAVREADGSARIYVDGAQDAYLAPSTIAPLVATNVYVGADMRDRIQYYTGLIDELHVVRRALSAAEIQALVGLAPRFLLHLNEAAGAYAFADDTELGHEATCATGHCPNAGLKGQINLAAHFDGVTDLLLSEYAVPASADKTIMAWVRPDSTSAGRHMVLSTTDDWSWALFRDGATWHVRPGSLITGGGDWDTGVKVQVGQWQHLAVAFSGNRARFFFNGHPTADLDIGDHSNAGRLGVACERASGISFWDGRIDEVAIYERALTDLEVEALWLYQGQWVQEAHITPLTVDNDKPASDLVSDSPYRPDAPVNLLIRTSDATSAVVRAEWQVDSGAWQVAPPCDADQGAAWCPTFDPAAFHGAGIYTIRTRATDAAGNISDTSSDPLYVDGAAPTVTTTSPQDEALVKLAPVPAVRGAWSLPIAGTVTEPAVASGVAGSGVRAVKVTLLDGYRRPVGDGAQLATVSGTAWTAAVTLSDPIQGGAYLIQVEAEDQVGNANSTDSATVYLDRTAPEATMEGLPAAGAILVLHLSEAAGATHFADGSGYGHDAVCGAACPTAGVPGHIDQAVELNGTSQSLAVSDALDFGSGDFALAAWFQTTSQTWQTIAAASTTGSPAQDLLLLQVTNGGKVRFTFAPDASVTNLTSPLAFHDGQWHQAAAVRQGSELLLYVDGEIVATKTDGRALSGPLRLALGQHGGAEFFQGRLDEVYVVPVALSGPDLHSLAIPYLTYDLWLEGVLSEVPLIDGAVMDLHLEETGGERFVDSSAWANDASCSGATCPARVTSGTFFGQALQFDGVDDRLMAPNWGALTAVTAAAWVQRTGATSTRETILSHKEHASCGFVLSINESKGSQYPRFFVRVGSAWLFVEQAVAVPTGEWVHLAGTYDGQTIRLFRDGVQVAERDAPGAMTDDCLADTAIGSRSSQDQHFFPGLIDEVMLFDRALSRDELLALGTKKHAGVSALEMAVVPASPGSALYITPMPAGAQLYLPLDDSAPASGGVQLLDISGQGRSASCTDPACPSLGHGGHAGGATGFDGVDDYVEVALDVSETAYGLALWFKTTCATCGIFSVDQGLRGAGGHDRHVYLSSGNVCTRVYSSEVKCTSGTNYADGRWHQVVHTFGGTEGGQKIYLDGALKVSGTKAASDFASQDGINLGFSNDAALDYFSGLLDEVILFNRALPEAEVRALYLGTEPVLRLAFDEEWAVDGTTLADSSGLGNDGTLHGATTDRAVAGAVGSGALQLDGSSDYVTAARSIDFARGDYSVTGWVRTSAKVQQLLFSATNPIGDTPGIQLYLDSTGVLHWLHRAPTGSSGGTDLRSTGPALNYGQWEHVAAVKQGTTLTLYHDGWPYATGAAGSGFEHALNVTVGRQGQTTAGAYLNGAVDDVRVYARALNAEELEDLVYNERWGSQYLSRSGTGVVRSTYGTSPGNVEGYYRFDLRSADTFDNRTDTGQGQALWNGILDNIYPRAELNYQITTVGSSQQVHYQFAARDFNLVENGFVSPCPASSTPTKEYFNAPWYRAWTGETDASSDRLWSLSGQCDLVYSGTLAKLTVCDSSGQCRTVSAKPLVVTAALEAGGGVLILEPRAGTFLTTTAPLSISGGAFSSDSLRQLTVQVDGETVADTEWPSSTVTDTAWTAGWMPSGEAPHLIEARLRDWAGAVYTDAVTVILDRQPPEVAIATTVLTTTHLAGGRVTVAGTASDANGIAAVDLQAGGVWRQAVVSDGEWAATWVPDLGAVPDGQVVSVVARAVDRAGWTALASHEGFVDAVAPAPVELALNYEAAGETIPITRTGTTVREPGPTLRMAWSASSDGSGLAGYRAGWTVVEAGGASTTTWTAVGPAEARMATTTAAEGQRLIASLRSRDNYGNTTWQGFGPIYADSPLTPDYIALDDPDGVYHGWMDSGCALVGVDRRINRIAPKLAMRHGEQALYATWNSQALRLAWTGANWSMEGDLFVYLDTVPGGSATAFNPFTPTATLSGMTASPMATPVSLPAGTGTSTQTETMAADYLVWVQDAQTASLLSWDGSAWITSTVLSAAQYRYQPGRDGGLTDLLLPFALVGITDPAAASLKLVAFASEEGALRLWAILPRANPVTSWLAMGNIGRMLPALAQRLIHSYQWPSLGSGLCPNGDLLLAAGQTPYPDAEVQARLVAEPVGIVYHYLGDHLFTWADYLLGDKPADFSGLLSLLAREHPYVRDGQVLTYTLHLQNSGQETARDVSAQVWAANALTLPGGAPAVGDAFGRYFQEVAVGDLAPGEERTVTFQGRIDLAWARPRYDECLAAQPQYPRLCALFLRAALLKVEIMDQTHTATSGPLEWIWADHRVDFQAPRFFGISQQGLHISPGSVGLRGYAYDESGVPELSLEVQRPDGNTVSLSCPNPAPAGGRWACDWDPTAVNGGVPPQDGQTFQVRLRAMDGVGQTSDPGPWQPLIVDSVPPTVTAQLVTAAAGTGLPASIRTLRLGGLLADNRGAAGVEVCLEDKCRSARTTLEGALRLQDYPDQPAAPVPLPACDSGRIERTFVVTDSFAVGNVGLGLRAELPVRGQIRAELVSPAGRRVQVLSGERYLGTGYQNYTVLLADLAGGDLSQLGGDHDTTVAGFLHLARPDEPLSAFMGEQAAGTWTLSLCDAAAGAGESAYLAGRLLLRPQNTAAPDGAWTGRLTLPELDGVERTLTVYGLDDAGNRTTEPFTHTFVVDNVAPELSVTQAISQVQMTPDLAPLGVLTGTVSDGGQVRRLFAAVHMPEGQLHIQPVTRDGDGWSFALRPRSAGLHALYIVAEDLAGNRTTVGPFAVEVAGIPAGVPVYLPLVVRGAIIRPPLRLYLPLVLKGAEGSSAPPEPEGPPTATATVTPTVTIMPTVTITPAVTITPTVAITATVTITPTLTVTPAVTITPTLTITPTQRPVEVISPTVTSTP